MMKDVLVPHLAFPFRMMAGGSVSVVEQDSLEEIGQCVEVFLRTTQGERIEIPEYGIGDPVFDVNLDTEAIISDLLEWEPRAEVLMSEAFDPEDELTRIVRARVTTITGEG